MKPRVALLTNIPTPYRLSFFRHLHQLVDLHVVFDALKEPDREWRLAHTDLDFPHSFTLGMRLSFARKRSDLAMQDERFLHLSLGQFFKLLQLKPDVVISGEFGARTLQALLYGWLTRTPVIIWSEVTPHTEARTSNWKTLLRRVMAHAATRFWTNGRESTTQLEAYGAKGIDPGMTGVDTRFFAEQTRQELLDRKRIRADLGLWGTTFLFVGRFIDLKGLDAYMQALDLLAKTHPQGWSLVFAGSGPLATQLQAWAMRHPDIPVHLPGFLATEELPRYFAASDVFVLPTLQDNWSLAALEATAAGLPQVFSRYNGGSADLLVASEAGRLLDPLDTVSFAATLADYVQAPPPRLSEAFADPIRTFYGPAQAALRAYHSIQAAISGGIAPAMTPEGARS